ncbi:LamB/YcsF family protein [SAR202 cluster bacterium AC-409-J13_OGT_754m]|nr:LamB/YcsF family protein [SAR202 cluster bacterium AC-409-J13_OGT_754m]
MKVDFNCDMGESFGMYKLGYDEEIIKYITSANIACGFHAGDPMWMRKTVDLAEEYNVGIGAQPSYPDLMGFGRRDLAVTPVEAINDLTYQIGALTAFTSNNKLQHVKPHGAMYNKAVVDENLARAICQSVLNVDPEMIIVALAGSEWVGIAEGMGLRVAREAFADRAVRSDGTLVPRSEPGAVIHDVGSVVERSVKMITENKVIAITGEELIIHADSICLHGDTPGALDIAKAVKAGLEKAGVEIKPMMDVVS